MKCSSGSACRALLVAVLTTVCGGCAAPAPSGTTASVVEFNADGLVFRYPDSWHLYPFPAGTMHSEIMAWVSTMELDSPCRRESAVSTCKLRGFRLSPHSAVVALDATSSLIGPQTLEEFAPGQPTEINGRPATFAARAGDDRTRSDTILVWTIQLPVGSNFLQVTADLRGPDADALREQVEALVASIRIDD